MGMIRRSEDGNDTKGGGNDTRVGGNDTRN